MGQIGRTAVEKGVLGHFAVNATVTKEPGLLGGICSACISLYKGRGSDYPPETLCPPRGGHPPRSPPVLGYLSWESGDSVQLRFEVFLWILNTFLTSLWRT